MTFYVDQNKRESIMRRLIRGDKAAFAAFIEKYQQQVFLCCNLLGLDRDESEDVASETFLAAYQGIGKYNGSSKLGTWLWKIAYNKAIDHIRQNINRRKLEQKLQRDYKDEQPAQFEDADTEIIWDAVKKLPQEHAMAIVLYYRQEKSVKEIADIMKKRQNTVKIYLFRGREKLKELLSNKLERLF